jgi:hypothetical protein
LTYKLSGTVLDHGVPSKGAYVRINGPSGDFVWEARTGENGTFAFNLPPGEWTLIAFGPGAERLTRQVTVEADTPDLLIELDRAS